MLRGPVGLPWSPGCASRASCAFSKTQNTPSRHSMVCMFLTDSLLMRLSSTVEADRRPAVPLSESDRATQRACTYICLSLGSAVVSSRQSLPTDSSAMTFLLSAQSRPACAKKPTRQAGAWGDHYARKIRNVDAAPAIPGVWCASSMFAVVRQYL